MARWQCFVAAGIAAAILGLPAPIQAQDGGARLPVSLERIRAALNDPPPVLRIPAPSADVPTFRVEIHQDFFAPQPLEDEPPLDPTLGLPSVGALVMGGIGKIGSAVSDYKRGRAKRRAKQEVADALAAFCAVNDCPAPARK